MTDHLLSSLSQEARLVCQTELLVRVGLARATIQRLRDEGAPATKEEERAIVDATLSGWSFAIKEARNLVMTERARTPERPARAKGTFVDEAGRVHVPAMKNGRARLRVILKPTCPTRVAEHMVSIGLRTGNGSMVGNVDDDGLELITRLSASIARVEYVPQEAPKA